MVNNIAVFCTDPTQRRELIEFLLKYGYKLPHKDGTIKPYLQTENLHSCSFIAILEENKIYQVDYRQTIEYNCKCLSLIEFVETVITNK